MKCSVRHPFSCYLFGGMHQCCGAVLLSSVHPHRLFYQQPEDVVLPSCCCQHAQRHTADILWNNTRHIQGSGVKRASSITNPTDFGGLLKPQKLQSPIVRCDIKHGVIILTTAFHLLLLHIEMRWRYRVVLPFLPLHELGSPLVYQGCALKLNRNTVLRHGSRLFLRKTICSSGGR